MLNNIKEEKSELREFMKAKRSALNPKEKRSYDRNICDSLKEIVLIEKPKVVHSYLPIQGEINVTPFLKWLLHSKVKVVCPRVLPKRQLENIELLHFDKFDNGPFNTIHPAGNITYSGNIDLVIMPGLAFDNKLNRLGYGGGYYDRFLVKCQNATKVAILYPFQLIDLVPTEEHDIKMDRVITSGFSAKKSLID